MKTKFNLLYEKVLHTLTEDVPGNSSTTREQSGGFNVGDRVALAGNITSSDWFKNQPSNLQEKIKEVAGSDLNIFVHEVKFSEGNQADLGVPGFTVRLTQELAPGVLDQASQLVVPTKLCEFLAPSSERAQAPIPDSWRGNERVTIKPEPVKLVGEEDNVSPPLPQTMKSDDGTGKLVDGDRSLPEKDTPGQPGGSYTGDYMNMGSRGLGT